MNVLLILFGKLLSMVSRFLNAGSGSTWPGHIALSVNKNFIKEIVKKNAHLKIILIAGTNGKTTTGKLMQTILESSENKVFQNEAGANLRSGIASSLLLRSSILSKINYNYAIFEIDEATLPLILKELSPDYLILLNLFRDQLDRYGEVNTIVKKWTDSIRHLSPKTKLIINADDPQIAYLGFYRSVIPITIPYRRRSYTSVIYFGLDDKTLRQTSHQHAVDSTYCPNCSSKLSYNTIYYSHLGDWECKNCKLKRPHLEISSIEYFPISGTYNQYNTLAAVLLSKQVGIEQKNINTALREFTPAFGRQEILNFDGKKVQIFLSKNPTSFNESLRTINNFGAKNVLLVLNDRIPDGRDVSWIWDVDFEDYVNNFKDIIISGDSVYDMGLRIKYSFSSEFQISNFLASRRSGQFPINVQFSNSKFQIVEDLREAVDLSLRKTPKKETLYILPTYSAMLEVRKILTGKKIL